MMEVIEDKIAGARRSTRAHDSILAAAAELAMAGGYMSTSIEKIASTANVGKQTIYRWWPNKAALYVEVYCNLVAAAAVVQDTGDLRSDLVHMTEHLFDIYERTPAATILSGLIVEAQGDPAAMEQLRQIYIEPRREILRAVIQRARKRGQAHPDVDADFVSDLFAGAVWFQLIVAPRKADADFMQKLVRSVAAIASAEI